MNKDVAWTLVTGGAKRVGAGICAELVKVGHPVVIHYNTSENEAFELMQKLQGSNVAVDIIQGDFSSRESVDEFVERYKSRFLRTKNLINNIGNYTVTNLEESTPDYAYSIFQTNFFTPFLRAASSKV